MDDAPHAPLAAKPTGTCMTAARGARVVASEAICGARSSPDRNACLPAGRADTAEPLNGQSTTGPDQASSAALSSQNTAGGQKRQCLLRPRIRPHPKTPYPQSRTNDRKPIPLVAALRAAPPILAGVASNAVTSAMRCRARQRDKRNELHWLVPSTAPRPAPPRNPAPTAQWQPVPRARNVQQVLKWHPPTGLDE